MGLERQASQYSNEARDKVYYHTTPIGGSDRGTDGVKIYYSDHYLAIQQMAQLASDAGFRAGAEWLYSEILKVQDSGGEVHVSAIEAIMEASGK